jgi:hypothetical protein
MMDHMPVCDSAAVACVGETLDREEEAGPNNTIIS